MKNFVFLALIAAASLCAQTPNLSGVWKADLTQSKLAGPAPQSILLILEQIDDKLTELTGTTTARGESRMNLTYNLAPGKTSTNQYRGAFMRSTAVLKDGALTIDSKIANTKPQALVAKYTASADGNTLTVESTFTANEKATVQTLVYTKQPDSAAADLRKPEKTAGEAEKNVKVLNTLAASQFIDAMRSFNIALNVECSFCHVQGDFAKDDKPEKVMARKMITMTHEINRQAFDGKVEVRCYTCHQGIAHPVSHPAYVAAAAK